MKKAIFLSAALLLVASVGVFIFLRPGERGMTPPAPNASEAPKLSTPGIMATGTTEKAPDYQMPTDFKLPNDLQIETPQVPEGVGSVAGDKG